MFARTRSALGVTVVEGPTPRDLSGFEIIDVVGEGPDWAIQF